MIKVKFFVPKTGNSFQKLEEWINSFIEKNNIEVIDIKCISSGSDGSHTINSAMLIYKEIPEDVVDFYYWDKEKNDYRLLPETLEAKTYQSEKELVELDATPGFAYMVREWLRLNAKCMAPVYLDKELNIHSKGDITILIKANSAQSIPEYIKFTKGRH